MLMLDIPSTCTYRVQVLNAEFDKTCVSQMTKEQASSHVGNILRLSALPIIFVHEYPRVPLGSR